VSESSGHADNAVADVHRRESEFWNSAAAQAMVDLDADTYRVSLADLSDPALPWLPYMGMPALVGQLLEGLGDLQGKHVLEIGSGTGFLAVALALRGATVTSTDIAGEALAIGRFRARVSGVEDRIRFLQVASEDLDFPDESFDAVAGIFVLHHLDLERSAPAIRRVLRQGGRAAFVETFARNRLLMFFRTHLTGRLGVSKASSEDEAPLDARAEARLQACFGGGFRVHYPELVFLRMAAANVPVLRARPLMWLLRGLDRCLWMIPASRRLGYFATIVLDPGVTERAIPGRRESPGVVR
jgi:2-polyprenyl-3-methyl-5-hydroxy-6-metoxy-1,4-benzoquinol methylase